MDRTAVALQDGITQSLLQWLGSVMPGAGDPNLSRLSGGANNLVFMAERGQSRLVVKAYPQADASAAERFTAETEFLAYANDVAPGFVPRVVAVDERLKYLAMEYLNGARFERADEITPQHVGRAAEFLKRLNTASDTAKAKISSPAVEGFLAISEHIENVSRRIHELAADHLPQQYHADARGLMANVTTAWDAARQAAEMALASGDVPDTLPAHHRCISPSDFGFHNAIKRTDGVAFFDFEYAGWDDPTKAVADFFLQPRLVVPGQFHDAFEAAVSSCMPTADLRRREATLRPILRLKWVTIVLAILRPQRFNALSQLKTPAEMPAFIEERLTRARHLLN